jgi:predicted SprT family Zn-dependent metalloprotease
MQVETEPSENENESEASTEKTLTDKYRCRQCGKTFNTIEEHDDHQRRHHNQTIFKPVTGMAL